jgi:hypothetical protein
LLFALLQREGLCIRHAAQVADLKMVGEQCQDSQ